MADITAQQPVTISVHNKQHGKPISRDLWGIFLEDINYAVDGGLNAELVQNGALNTTAPITPAGVTCSAGRSATSAMATATYPYALTSRRPRKTRTI
ncbi:hypothetical protein [Bifidobacterium felsineum]|uniref:hypothetical protein n=1 Tax=Bifidobacterium felsineum TaxID=2045440 RepID=UPI001BDDC7AE|nr:hypothetical protein [Bifidobacterium felsineum]MBT1163058.1 hypothetical protein [Bifidobacterium felsineum]